MSSSKGVTVIPKKLPKAELNIAAASFPPMDLVIMTADETGGGIQPTTCNLGRRNKALVKDIMKQQLKICLSGQWEVNIGRYQLAHFHIPSLSRSTQSR